MPGIHFAEARARIALADVLDLLGFVPCESSGDQVRGPCPVHHSISPSSRSFSANLKRHIYRCFKCGSCGNQLDLYASTAGEPQNRHLTGIAWPRLRAGGTGGHRGFVFQATSFGDRSVPRAQKLMPNPHEKTTDGRFTFLTGKEQVTGVVS